MSKPIRKLGCGNVSAAVWVNENGSKSVSFQYSFKTQSGEWKHISSIPIFALPDLSVLVNRLAQEAITEQGSQKVEQSIPQNTNDLPF